jgi:CRISPR system Cascade subunit CasB
MSLSFAPDKPVGQALQDFWKTLQENRGERAELRRCRSPNEVVLTPMFSRFCCRLQALMEKEAYWQDRIAAILGLLAHIETESPLRLPEQMSERKGEGVVVSELRFRRLLQCDRDKLYGSLIRVLHMLNQTANIFDLAGSVYFWGDKVKKDWAYLYFPRVPEK